LIGADDCAIAREIEARYVAFVIDVVPIQLISVVPDAVTQQDATDLDTDSVELPALRVFFLGGVTRSFLLRDVLLDLFRYPPWPTAASDTDALWEASGALESPELGL
jgi:hypothetical protein